MANVNRSFTSDEVNSIIRRALEGQRDRDDLPYDELVDIAAQFHISPGQLAQAIHDEETYGELDRARIAWQQKQRTKFQEHLFSYIIINGALVLMNYMTTDYPWVLWSIVGWGIGLAFDAAETYFPNPEKVERGAQKMLAREKRLRDRQGFARI